MVHVRYLDYSLEELNENGGRHTAQEIARQPELWQQVYDLVCSKKEALTQFLTPLLQHKTLRIILSGAGSSAFIGEAVQGSMQAETGRLTQAIATTDLVTHPDLYFLRNVPTLLISFARSGNSPESLEAVNLANRHCRQVFHLIITCNKAGELVQHAVGKNCFRFILPDASNDKSLAMTGSFSSMLLAITLIAKLHHIEALLPELEEIIQTGTELTTQCLKPLKEVACRDFERVVFLGSGPLLGIARECHLKLQELTDGRVICKHDSFLGFRHGPRAVVNKKTLLVYLFSPDEHVFQYEKDLALSIAADASGTPVISYGRKLNGMKNVLLNIVPQMAKAAGELYFIPTVLVGQLLGFYKSLQLGLPPDNPSVSGAISRVVQGVTIYAFEPDGK